MKAPKLVTSFALLGAVLACDPAVVDDPLPAENALVIPDLQLSQAAGRRSVSLTAAADEASLADASDSEAVEAATYCEGWSRTEESYDPATGAFSTIDECTDDGGDIARIVTAGTDDGTGAGSYDSTYELRDGGEIVWTYAFSYDEVTGEQTLDGSSSEGETHSAVYGFDTITGATVVQEEYELIEGSYVIDGSYDEQGRFSGTSVFDDPATAASPDYSLVQTENDDGFSQEVEGADDIGTYSYSWIQDALGAAVYAFESDDAATAVTPDYSGEYTYAVDGSGEGGYVQLYDDNSKLVVEDTWSLDSLVESWIFDDAATDLAIDQLGSITYVADGTGSGSITTFAEDGSSETCGVTVAADGTSTTTCDADA